MKRGCLRILSICALFCFWSSRFLLWCNINDTQENPTVRLGVSFSDGWGFSHGVVGETIRGPPPDSVLHASAIQKEIETKHVGFLCIFIFWPSWSIFNLGFPGADFFCFGLKANTHWHLTVRLSSSFSHGWGFSHGVWEEP